MFLLRVVAPDSSSRPSLIVIDVSLANASRSARSRAP